MCKLFFRCSSVVICVALLAFPPSVFAEEVHPTTEEVHPTTENEVVTPESPIFGETVHMQANGGAQGFTVYPSGEFQFQSYGRILNGRITNKDIQFGSLRLVVTSKPKDNGKQQTRVEYSMNGKQVSVTHTKGATSEELIADKEFDQLMTSFVASEEGRLTAELGAFLAAQRGQSYASGDHHASGAISCTRAIMDAAALGAVAAYTCSTLACGPASLACCVAAAQVYMDALEAISVNQDCIMFNSPVRY